MNDTLQDRKVIASNKAENILDRIQELETEVKHFWHELNEQEKTVLDLSLSKAFYAIDDIFLEIRKIRKRIQ